MKENIETLIFFYNTMWKTLLSFSQKELPKGCTITTDHNSFLQADAVVFHLPDLASVMEEEIIKPNGQIWVAWNLKCEETLIETNSNYKFVISFENALTKDYITEKFYNPLLSGTVPVYLGAPNILEFAPGKDCFIDVTAFESPRELADFMNACYEDEHLYSHFSKWKEQSLLLDFRNKIEIVKTNPFIRLCLKIQELKSERDGQ